MKKIIIYLSVVLLSASIALADDQNFATTSEDIIKQLATSADESGEDSGEIELQAAETMSFQTNAIQVVDEKDYAEEVTRSSVAVQKKSSVNLKVEFDSNSFAVRPESFTILVELTKAVKSPELKDKIFIINGHTDSQGSNDYNRDLSLSRANTIKQFLTANGISQERIKTIGHGEEFPLLPNDTPTNRQVNRRVEIAIE
ncbi:OmpA family protein [Thermodesulfobacteriota bacterium]